MSGWEKKLRNIGWAYYRFYQEDTNYFRILFFLQHGDMASRVSSSLYQRCFDKALSCLNVLSRVIAEGMAVGEIGKPRPMDLAMVLWGSMNGIIHLYEEEEHRKFISSSLDELVTLTMDLLVKGLKGR